MVHQYTIYNTTTGRILRTIEVVNQADVSLNVGLGEASIIGYNDGELFFIDTANANIVVAPRLVNPSVIPPVAGVVGTNIVISLVPNPSTVAIFNSGGIQVLASGVVTTGSVSFTPPYADWFDIEIDSFPFQRVTISLDIA